MVETNGGGVPLPECSRGVSLPYVRTQTLRACAVSDDRFRKSDVEALHKGDNKTCGERGWPQRDPSVIVP